MDFKDTSEEAHWREEVCGFLQSELPAVKAAMRGNRGWLEGGGDGERPDTRARSGADTRERMSGGMKAWREKLREKGWIAPAWPKEVGGGGLSVKEQFILNEEFAEARAPQVGGFGVMMFGPTLIVHGTEDGVLPFPNGRQIAALMPQARLEVLEGVGHMFWWEQPQRSAELIREHALAANRA